MNRTMTAATLALILAAAASRAALMGEAVVVNERVIQVYARDGHGVYPGAHETTPERIEEKKLDAKKAARPAAWSVESADDPGFAKPVRPARVGRKTKGRDCVIETPWKPGYTHEHWLYLVLAGPMTPGRTYTVRAKGLFTGASEVSVRYDPSAVRSEAVHASQIGYAPDATKYAYVSMWMGDLGPLDLAGWKGARFRVLDAATGASAYEGALTLRREANGPPDSAQPNEKAPGFRAMVLEADFSPLSKPGEYVVSVERMGVSYPFKVGADAYREAFYAAMQGMYQQRCGTALVKPYTEWTRPLCHHPSIKPVFQSKRRYMEGHCDGCKEVESTGEKRDVWGGYHDAGDWDREGGHVEIPALLSLVYELFPGHFTDGECGIPEAGNGIPDILDEAKWAVDYYVRLQQPDGGVGTGLFVDSFPDPGEGPGWDASNWYIYAPDPEASYKFAASACHFSFACGKAGKPEMGKPYVEAARKAWDWAEKNQRPGDAARVRDNRVWAAACLFRATGGKAYHDAFVADLKVKTADDPIWIYAEREQEWACLAYDLCERPGTDLALRDRLRKATVKYAREFYVDTAAKRTARLAGNIWQPLTWGFGSTPKNFSLMVAWKLTGEKGFLAAARTTCDFMLGGNPLNMVWMSQTGKRFPEMLFHPDSWYSPKGPAVAPGIVAQGPVRYDGPGGAEANGPWSPEWMERSAYPSAADWPPYELYFEGRTCYPMNETTVWQIAASAASYGALCADVAR